MSQKPGMEVIAELATGLGTKPGTASVRHYGFTDHKAPPSQAMAWMLQVNGGCCSHAPQPWSPLLPRHRTIKAAYFSPRTQQAARAFLRPSPSVNQVRRRPMPQGRIVREPKTVFAIELLPVEPHLGNRFIATVSIRFDANYEDSQKSPRQAGFDTDRTLANIVVNQAPFVETAAQLFCINPVSTFCPYEHY